MLLDNVRNWFGGIGVGAPAEAGAEARPNGPEGAEPPACRPKPESRWLASRLDLVEQLWGEGFLFPGGHDEALRLARPLGLSSAASLLLVGAGSGGPSRSIASQLGVWVSGFEADPDLAALAMERSTRARLGRRAQVEMWYPQSPAFRAQSFHHALAIEPMREARPEPLLAAIGDALKPGGQFVLVDAVADEPLDPACPTVRAWCRLEHRSPELPSERAIARMLGRLGFEVRVAEDITDRHVRMALLGWRDAVRALEGSRLGPARGAGLVAEAELWLTRLKLMREGRVRLLRWHAFGSRRDPA